VHILIVPKKHIDGVIQLSDEDNELISHIILVSKKIAHEHGISEKGFRIVVNSGPDAGQAVFHIHFHLLGGRKLTWPPG
jgi:histidine triad (HIT) family protein